MVPTVDDHHAGFPADTERAVISGLQTLRVIAIAAGGAFFLLVLPSAFVSSRGFFQIGAQVPHIAFVLLGAAGAALLIRWLQLRTDSPRSAQDLALSYRTRFLLSAAAAQIPGILAFGFSIFARPFPGLAVTLGVLATAGLVFVVAPTTRTLDRLQDEARENQIHDDVRGVLDDLYTWQP